MNNILINYSQLKYHKSRKNNSKSGLEVGGFNKVIEYTEKDLDSSFKEKNKSILKNKKGAGYWLWKPYIIYKTLQTMSSDDIMFYCDSGCDFIGGFNEYLFDICRKDEKGLVLFTGRQRSSRFTKRDCFVYMNADTPKYKNSRMLQASFQLCRKTNFVVNFYKECLEYGQDSKIITDAPNVCGLKNPKGFKAHRHDQSILSILQKKYGVTTFECPSQFGNPRREDGFKQLINHHRCSG